MGQSVRSAQAQGCLALHLGVNQLNDKTWVQWVPQQAASSIEIWRQRFQGTWRLITTASPTARTFLDLGVNPKGIVTYRAVLRWTDGSPTTTCDLADDQGPYFLSTSTPDGHGIPDAAVGGSTLEQQNPYTLSNPLLANGQEQWAPAYSPNGRVVAIGGPATTGDRWLELRDARSGALIRSLSGDGFQNDNPAFSPDGRWLAFDAFAGVVGGTRLTLVDLTGAVKPRSIEGVASPYSFTNVTTLIVRSAGRLAQLCVTCATPTPVPGTEGATDLEGTPDGTIYFVTVDAPQSKPPCEIWKRSPAGAVTSVLSSETVCFGSPRLSPDGRTLFYVQIDPGSLDPGDETYRVEMLAVAAGGATGGTTIGAEQVPRTELFRGYDVRQPKSTGTSDLAGDANPDILARDASGNLWAYPLTEDPTSGTPKVGTRVRVGTGWQVYNAFLAAGDLNGDNRGDIIARDTSGRLFRYFGLGRGKVAPRVQIGWGWNGYVPVATGDFDGDGRADIVARDRYGNLWLYPGNGSGGLTARKRIGLGWNVMTAIVGAGDFDYDNDADLIARDTLGNLWLYPGNGKGGFEPRRKVGAGWNVFTAIAGPEQVGATVTIIGRNRNGHLIAYGVTGDGRFDPEMVADISYGWNTYSLTS